MSAIRFCRQWNTKLNKPIYAYSAKRAKDLDAKGELYTVVLGDDPTNPFAFVEIAWRSGYVGLWLTDEDGRREFCYTYHKQPDGRLFLSEITRWQYADGAGRGLDDSELNEHVSYKVDGSVVHEVRDKLTVTTTRYADVPLTINWATVPSFGEWESLALQWIPPYPGLAELQAGG